MTAELEDKLTRVLLELPIGYNINGRHFYMYQPTLGTGQLIGGLIKQLEFDARHLAMSTNMEILRVVAKQPELCLRIIALTSCKGRECLDNCKVTKIITYLKRNTKPDDVVLLLQMALQVIDTKDLEQEYGITDDLKEYQRIQELKDEGGSYSFCGKSIYGGVISTLAEKYGWTMDYILWDISQANVHMLLADNVKTIYLSDTERKRIHPRRGSGNVIKADDPANKELILSMEWD